MKEYIQVKGKGIKVYLNELIYSSYVCIVCKQALYFECSGEQEALSCAPRVWLFTVIILQLKASVSSFSDLLTDAS